MSYTASYIVNSSSAQGATDFQFTFPYIKEEHIEVFLNFSKITQGSGSAQYQVITNVSPKLIRLNTGIASANLRVEVRRNSSLGSPLVDYADGSTLTANDLDTSALQSLYIDQELKDNQGKTVSVDEDTGLPSMGESSAGNLRLTKVADPTAAQDAATKNYVDTKDALQVTKAGDSMTGALAMGTNKVTGVGDPTAAQDVATKNYVDTKVFSSGQLSNVVVTTTNITDGTIVAGDLVTGTLDGRYYTETELDAGQLDNRYYTETELNAGQLDNRYFTETELTGGALDGRYFTETEADARYFNISSGETIKDGDAFPDNDTTIATTAAINDRIIDLVDDVGGFVPIANETSFPTANPDVNNGTGTLVSIKEFASSHTPSGGTVTIANGAGSGNTVTITGCGSTVLTAGFGGIVETTSTLHTYTFHRLSPKATEVTTVAGISGNITTVAGIAANVTTVAGISANVTTVATNNTNVTNVGGSIANVNTVATNLSGVNNFADRYRVASSAPGSNNDEGDLYFDTTSNELKVYNGSAWQGGVTATGNLAGLGTNTFTGAQTFVAGQTFDGRDVSVDGTKLDGIETAATADQTNAEIRAAVEAAGDSNVFTDADHTKLNGIEASATADQTKSDIDSLNINADQLDGQHGAYYQDASNLNAGTIPDARFPATLPAASGANLTSLPAANLTGTLPSISGANLTNLPASGGEITGTASGALTNARAVKVNTNGTFSQAALAPPSWGNSHTPISGAAIAYAQICYVEDNKFLVCWYDSNATSAKAVVCEVNSNGTVTWGTPVVPQTYANSVNQIAWDKDNNIGIYNTIGNSNGFFGIQFTISGLTPTFGTGLSYPIGSGTDTWNGKLIYGKAGKFGFWYVIYNQLRWFRWASNPSNVNTAPSYLNGGSQSTSSSATTRIAGCWNSVNEKFCVFYHGGTSYFYAQLFNSGASSSITSSGSQSLVSPHVGSSHYYGNLQVVYDNVNEKYLFGWVNSSWRQQLRAATNTGSSWSFGTTITVTDSSDSNESTMWQYNHTPWMTWNSTSEEFTVMWGVSGKMKFKDPTISGTTITRGDTYEVSTTITTSQNRAMLHTSEDSSRWLLLYGETNSLTKGLTRQGTSTSISNDNYVGFSDGTFSNGQTATIQLPGTVVDGLSGLTTGSKYYVSGDGTVSLVDTYYTNLVAGVALSSSTLLLK